jgi:hypothetical protein
MSLETHKALSAVRAKAYEDLFACSPSVVFPHHALFKKPDERFPIDIFVYTLEAKQGEIEVAVTDSAYSPDEIRAGLDRVHEQVLRELPGLGEAELDQPAPHPGRADLAGSGGHPASAAAEV